MKGDKHYLYVMILLLFASCYNGKTDLAFDREIIVKGSSYQDSVHEVLNIKNRGKDTVELMIIPECDCTMVRPECLKLIPHSSQHVDIAFFVDSKYNYEKTLYLKRKTTGEWDTIVIRGNVQ